MHGRRSKMSPAEREVSVAIVLHGAGIPGGSSLTGRMWREIY